MLMISDDVWINPRLHLVALTHCSKVSKLPTIQQGYEVGCKSNDVQVHPHAMPQHG